MRTAESWLPRRVVVYDPGFVHRCGHHYTYNSLLRDAFSRHGKTAGFLCSGHLPDDVAEEFPGIRRELRTLLYEAETAESALDRRQRRAHEHVRDLNELAGPLCDGDTLCFAHTLDPEGLLGAALWMDSLPEGKRPALALNVMLGAEDEAAFREQLAPAAGLFRGRERIRLFGGTPALARVLSELTDVPCRMLPTPLPETLRRLAGPPEGIAYGVYGDARRGKNLHILPSAMARYLTGGGRGVFSVSVTPTDIGLNATLVALHELAREFPQRVRISFRHLGVHEYYGGMAASTAIVAPHSYGRFRPSGIAIESAALGVPLIGLAGSFAEDELGELQNGSLFLPRPTPALLAEALLRFDEEYAERGARARIAAKRYAGRQGMEALLRCLFGARDDIA